jgi:riboflavin biosynthesis pyrimidine reductase
LDLSAAYAYPDDRAWLRANMVTSTDGSAVVSGRSAGLGGPVDHEVFAALRGLADAVVVGAGTARTEGYRALRARADVAEARRDRGQRPAPVLVLVSNRLDLDPDSELFHGGAERTIVLTHGASNGDRRAALENVADVVVTGADHLDLPAALDRLAERRLTRLLCEGGPHLLADVAAAGLLDELCLTVAPRLVGGAGTRIVSGPDLDMPLQLAQLLESDGTLFARYLRASDGR